MSYSQNNEEEVIVSYFRGKTGRFLDLGAYDGKEFSNTLRLAELGWSGVLVEPSPIQFLKLCELHGGNPNLVLLNAAISVMPEIRKFYLEKHWGSTISEDIRKLHHNLHWSWEYHLFAVSVLHLTQPPFFPNYDFVSVDIEGNDFQVCKAMRELLSRSSMLCVEHGGRDRDNFKALFDDIGMYIVLDNGENFLACKPVT